MAWSTNRGAIGAAQVQRNTEPQAGTRRGRQRARLAMSQITEPTERPLPRDAKVHRMAGLAPVQHMCLGQKPIPTDSIRLNARPLRTWAAILGVKLTGGGGHKQAEDETQPGAQERRPARMWPITTPVGPSHRMNS